MRLERVKNTKRNILVGETDKIVGILLPFIVRTMIIHVMGAEYLGLTSLFYSILQMLNLMDMGFGSSIIYSMYKPIAENDEKTISALMRFYSKVYRVIGLSMLGVGIALLPFLPHLIKGEPPEDINIYILYLIFVGNSVLNCLLFPNRKALFTAYQRDDVSGVMHIITQVLMYATQMIAVMLSKDYYLYILTIPASTVIYSVLCAISGRKMFGTYSKGEKLPEDVYKNIRKQVVGLMVRKIASYSRNAFDSMFVSAYLGLAINGIYGNYYYVMDAIVMVLAVLKTSMAGGVGNSIAMETVEKNNVDMTTFNFLFMTISGWCAICLLCLYQPFMKIWVGEALSLPMYMALTFSIYFYILKMADIRTLYAESVGIWWQGRYLSVIEAVMNILLNWLFIKFMGLFGIVLATMISYFIFNFIGGAILLYKYYFKNVSIKDYFVQHAIYLFVTCIIAVPTFFVSEMIKVDGIPGLILKALICVFIPGIMYLLIYCRTENFKKAVKLIKL
ncbi:MAG: oligosaccharide flippase family protein [Eubacterium sp.]|nr:oligosaccharide flippase family protein [Eubacterium sp.]